MSSPLGCPRCGFQNAAGYQFCVNCGAPLAPAPGGPAPSVHAPAAPYAAPPSYAPYGAPVDYDRAKRIDRTKMGVLFLLFGSLISWIPVVALLGYLLIFVGVIMEILGRRAFGQVHSRNVVLSLVLLIVGVIVLLGFAIFTALANMSGVIGPGNTVNVTPAFLASVASGELLGSIVVAVIIGVAEVLLTHALQVQNGRMLLWAGFGASVALSIVFYVILSPLYGAVRTQTDFNNAAMAQQVYSLLSAIPALLFAGADYLAWARINRGEIPAALPTPVGSPPMMPPPTGPAPPMNPK